VWRGFNGRTFLFGIYGIFCWTHRRGIVGRTPMSPLWLSADARAFYSLIKDLFKSEALGICLAKLQTFLVSDTMRFTIDYKY